MIRRTQKRRGFTLVELLVVIGIIVTLLSLLMAGFSAVRSRQQEKATDDIVFKVQTAIENQRKALVDQAAEDGRKRTNSFPAVVQYCDGDEERALALLTYLKLRHAFPQNYTEATSNVVLTSGTTTYVNWPPHKAYAAPALPNVSTWTPHEQSAAILFAGMSNMATSGAEFATDDATSGNQMDYAKGGVTARVFKDARGNPIGLKRFVSATQLPELNLAPYTNVKDPRKDCFDPLSKLQSWSSTKKGIAESAVGALFDNNNKSITAYSLGQNKVDESLLGDDVLGYRLFKLGNRGSAE